MGSKESSDIVPQSSAWTQSLKVFTIHILLYGHTFPMAYCLLPNKQRQTYNRAFMLLKDEAVGLGLSFDPLVIVSDFELAMVQASTMSFSNTPPWLLLPLHASNLEKGSSSGVGH